jgi:hypothetical protein
VHNGHGEKGGYASLRGEQVGPINLCNTRTGRMVSLAAKWPHQPAAEASKRQCGETAPRGPHVGAALQSWVAWMERCIGPIWRPMAQLGFYSFFFFFFFLFHFPIMYPFYFESQI